MAEKLVVIDMQNDFIDGALANPAAKAIIPRVNELIAQARANGTQVIFTQDTHAAPDHYLQTSEGKHLPIPHCEFGTHGWEISPELDKQNGDLFVLKNFFAYDKWRAILQPGDHVTVCGVVTSICVAANVSVMKAIPYIEVTVVRDATADLSNELKEAAIKVMQAQQAEVI